ncbi:MAG: sigma-54 dependent transcriptional regulator [Pseudomonadota bacterium]
MPHVLVVDDDTDAASGLADLVALEGFTTATAKSLEDARRQMAFQKPDVVLLDLFLPDGSGMSLFENVEESMNTEIVLITGHATLESSIQAFRLGAADYLIKPVNVKHLKGILSRVARPSDFRAEIDLLREELRNFGRFGQLIGVSPAMQKVYDRIARVSSTGVTVLIEGESGTGKELVAATIHSLSRRRNKPFLAVNCGAISPQLIESEMFGHEKGSFTGANRQHLGYFERAHGGTLFLDEITEMPMELQVKLLRVLEAGSFMRVGSDQQVDVDVRVIAATNRIPAEAVAQGKLREDLLYRLQVFPLQLPPLRDRKEDIEVLANNFLGEMNKTESSEKKLAPTAIERLCTYHWAGNVRELKNVVHRAFIMAEGNIIESSCLPEYLEIPRADTGPTVSVRVGSRLSDAERKIILATLDQCGGVRAVAADVLGISLKTLYNRLREYRSEF